MLETLDNMDGKQARKIGASSSLGLLFDHGCDSLSAFFQGMTMSRMLMVGNFGTMISLMLPSLMFFMATYEQ